MHSKIVLDVATVAHRMNPVLMTQLPESYMYCSLAHSSKSVF